MQVTRKEPAYLSTDHVLQAQKELLQLKAAIGRTNKQLKDLQSNAHAYSDADYCQYSMQFEPLLQQMSELCDTAREDQIGLILEIQGLLDDASRRVLYARSASAAAIWQETQQRVQQRCVDQHLIWQLVKKQVRGLYQKMRCQQGLNAGPVRSQEDKQSQRQAAVGSGGSNIVEWRYPPSQYILWRYKGRVGASKPPLEMPGLSRTMPEIRQSSRQL